MSKNFKTKFQNFHYSKQDLGFALKMGLSIGEFFYKNIINFKNFVYKIGLKREYKTGVSVLCVGNLTTGGVGKTPIVIKLANEYSQTKKVAIVSRGYGAKISNKEPVVIKDNKGVKFENGTMCGDEPYQIAKKTMGNVVVIICKNRKKAIEHAIIKYGIEIVILDDGFSNRQIKKDRTILAIDSKMRFGNNHLLPYGPLREPVSQISRADEIYLVDKADENLQDAISWAKGFNKPLSVCKMRPCRIYNLQTKAEVLNRKKAVAFCAIGQPQQFFDFAKDYYEIVETVAFDDHYKYTKDDIKKLIQIARKHKTNVFLTTQKDETKLMEIINDFNNYSFNVLELECVIEKLAQD